MNTEEGVRLHRKMERQKAGRWWADMRETVWEEARLARSMGDHARSIRLLRNIQSSGDPDGKVILAGAMIAAGQTAAAARLLESAERVARARGRIILANTALRLMGRPFAAEFDAKTTPRLYLRGLRGDQGALSELLSFEKALADSGGFHDAALACSFRAILLVHEGLVHEARTALERTMASHGPPPLWVVRNLAVVAALDADYDQAKRRAGEARRLARGMGTSREFRLMGKLRRDLQRGVTINVPYMDRLLGVDLLVQSRFVKTYLGISNGTGR